MMILSLTVVVKSPILGSWNVPIIKFDFAYCQSSVISSCMFVLYSKVFPAHSASSTVFYFDVFSTFLLEVDFVLPFLSFFLNRVFKIGGNMCFKLELLLFGYSL